MPKRSSKPSSDPNVAAFRAVQSLTEDKRASPAKKNPAAVALGRLGGKKGGPARAAKLSAKKRQQIARKAANARWGPNPAQ
jgi:hypothetical protein